MNEDITLRKQIATFTSSHTSQESWTRFALMAFVKIFVWANNASSSVRKHTTEAEINIQILKEMICRHSGTQQSSNMAPFSEFFALFDTMHFKRDSYRHQARFESYNSLYVIDPSQAWRNDFVVSNKGFQKSAFFLLRLELFIGKPISKFIEDPVIILTKSGLPIPKKK